MTKYIMSRRLLTEAEQRDNQVRMVNLLPSVLLVKGAYSIDNRLLEEILIVALGANLRLEPDPREEQNG